LMQFLGIERAYLMDVSGGGALAIDFTLEHPEMVDALIPVASGVSGYRPSEAVLQTHPEVARMYTVIITGTAHHPFLEKPAEFNQIVLDFLGSLTS
jgi:pimeloyl-ACP methyl ester carboxylesterase